MPNEFNKKKFKIVKYKMYSEEDKIKKFKSSPFANAAKTNHITIVKEYLLLRSTRIYVTNSPKWHMKCLLLKSTNVAIEGSDIDTSNKIKEIFYLIIIMSILYSVLHYIIFYYCIGLH